MNGKALSQSLRCLLPVLGLLTLALPPLPGQAAVPPLTLLHTLRHPDVSSVVFSLDGKTLATGGGDWATPDCVRLWDVNTGRLIRTLHDHRDDWNVSGVSFAPDGRTIAYACDDKVRLWDVSTGRLVRVFPGEYVGDIEISPHGRLLVGGSSTYESGNESNVQVWDLRSGRRRTLPRSKGFGAVTFSVDGHRLIGISNDETHPVERTWDAGTGHVLATHSLPRRTLPLTFSPDRRTFVTGVWDAPAHEPVALWDAQTGERLCLLSGPHHKVRAAAFSPTHSWLITGGEDQDESRGELLLWDRRTGKQLSSQRSLSFAKSKPRSVSGPGNRLRLRRTRNNHTHAAIATVQASKAQSTEECLYAISSSVSVCHRSGRSK